MFNKDTIQKHRKEIDQLKESQKDIRKLNDEIKKTREELSIINATSNRMKESYGKFDDQIIEYQEIGKNLQFFHLWRQKAFTLCLTFNSFFLFLLKFKEDIDSPIDISFFTITLSLKTLFGLSGLLGTFTCLAMDIKTYHYYHKLKIYVQDFEKDRPLDLYGKLFEMEKGWTIIKNLIYSPIGIFYSGKLPILVTPFLRIFYIAFIVLWIIILTPIFIQI